MDKYVGYSKLRGRYDLLDRLDNRPSDNPYPNAWLARQMDPRVQERLDVQTRPRGVHVQSLRIASRIVHERGFDVEAGLYDPLHYHSLLRDKLALAEEMSDGIVFPEDRDQRLFEEYVFPEMLRRARHFSGPMPSEDEDDFEEGYVS